MHMQGPFLLMHMCSTFRPMYVLHMQNTFRLMHVLHMQDTRALRPHAKHARSVQASLLCKGCALASAARRVVTSYIAQPRVNAPLLQAPRFCLQSCLGSCSYACSYACGPAVMPAAMPLVKPSYGDSAGQ